MYRQTGVKPAELQNLVELPDSCLNAWRYFIDLSTSRTAGMTANPIAFTEMQAYFELMQIEPYDWEIRLIMKFDSIWLEHMHKEQKKKNTNKKK